MSCLPFSFQNNILLIIWEFHICTPVIVIAQSTRSTMHFCDSFTPAKKTKDKGKKYIESSLYCSYTHCKRSFLWPLQSAPAQIMDFHMLSGDSKDHKHPHGLQWQHSPQTSTWHQMTVQTIGINMALGSRTNIHMTFSGNMGYIHQHSPWLQLDHRRQHGPH